MTSTITIRPFTPQNQRMAGDLVLQGLGEHFGFVDQTANPDLDDIAKAYSDGGFFCAWEGEDLVATGALVDESPGVARVVRMSVAASRRRQGVGSMVLRYLLSVARSKGFREVVLETNDDWHEVIAFYERHGFVETRRGDGGIHFTLSLSRPM